MKSIKDGSLYLYFERWQKQLSWPIHHFPSFWSALHSSLSIHQVFETAYGIMLHQKDSKAAAGKGCRPFGTCPAPTKNSPPKSEIERQAAKKIGSFYIEEHPRLKIEWPW